MKITVHRGTTQIGGCVTEYEYNGWRLFVDYGEQLPSTIISETPLNIEGLTCGDISKSALLITHYHNDHIGKLGDIPSELPIFIGKTAKEIQLAYTDHVGHASETYRKIEKRLAQASTFTPGVEFEFGDFKIMPVMIDHSAFDAYAFCIKANKLSVFHTGDFRTHGFRGSKLPKVIEKYVGHVDYVVCEATNVIRPDANNIPEYELQKKFERAFQENKYNIVYVSSTNIDRLFALYHAADKSGRSFYVDDYQKKIMDIVANRDHIWGKSRLYKYVAGNEPIVLHRDGRGFRINNKFIDLLTDKGYVIIAREGERFDNLISQFPQEGRKIYLSKWKGYADKSQAAYSPALAKSLGESYEYLHTSGHCDMNSLDSLINMLRPKAIIPIHTDNPRAFADLFCEKWPVIILQDGTPFAPIDLSGKDTITVHAIATDTPSADIEVIDNPENLKWWSIDDRCIGNFRRWEDAETALRQVIYAPNRLLAFCIEEEEGFEPFAFRIYNPDLTIRTEYNYGGHNPGGKYYQQPSGFKAGDRILAAIYPNFDSIIPCEVVGPITEIYQKEVFKDSEASLFFSSYNKYAKTLSDWDWDTVIVRPLVRLTKGIAEMPKEMDVQRVFMFPYEGIDTEQV